MFFKALFKKYFIPHKDNNHQPHILRKRAVLAILAFLFLVEGFFLVQIFLLFPNTNLFSSVLPSVLVDLTNLDRQQTNSEPLQINALLEKAAQLKAEDMARKGYFAHTSSEGVTPWFWLEKAGYSFKGAGENLAINFSDSKDVSEAWMNSAGHRANILNKNFTEIGIAAAKGAYRGKETIFIVQFFGQPLATTVSKEAVSPQRQEFKLSETDKSTGTVKASEIKAETNQTYNETKELIIDGSGKQEMFIVKEASEESVAADNNPSANKKQPLKEAESSLIKRVFSMPRNATNLIYLAIAGLLAIALFLKVFIKIRIQYPKLIIRGIILLFLIISILYFNYFLTFGGNIF